MSIRANSTFCWLPPDSDATGCVGARLERPALEDLAPRPRARRAGSPRPPRLTLARLDRLTFSTTERPNTRPCSLRDSGSIARPLRRLADGPPLSERPPDSSTLPGTAAVGPEDRPRQLGAAGARPARPRRGSRPREAPATRRSRPGRAGRARRAPPAGLRLRPGFVREGGAERPPEHALDQGVLASPPAAGRVRTSWPSRRIVTRVRELEHLAQEVGHEQDRLARARQRADDLVEPLDVRARRAQRTARPSRSAPRRATAPAGSPPAAARRCAAARLGGRPAARSPAASASCS